MWQRCTLAIPSNVRAVSCSVVAAHPWVVELGRREESGVYLSPLNAIDYLVGRLSGVSANQDVTVIMLTAPTIARFIDALSAAARVLPITHLTQVHRRAVSARALDVSKMQIPAAPSGLPPCVPLSIASTRAAERAQAIQGAISGTGGGDLAGALAQFTQLRAQSLADAATALMELQTGSFTAWVNSTVGDTAAAVASLKRGIPEPDAVFTLALLFVGPDLAALREMVD